MPTRHDIIVQFPHILERMQSKATQLGKVGVAVIGVLGHDRSLQSLSRDCGKMSADQWNFLAVAFSKVAEMCDTFSDSGSQVREIYTGEFGYVGGAIRVIDDGHVIAAFSGATGEEDLAISLAGLDGMS